MDIPFTNAGTLTVSTGTLRIHGGRIEHRDDQRALRGHDHFTSNFDVTAGTLHGGGTLKLSGGTINMTPGTYNVSGRST